MKIIRFEWQGGVSRGVLEGEHVYALNGDFPSLCKGEYLCEVSTVRLLAPCAPTKVVGVGQNYRGPLDEPYLFLKTTETVVGPGETIQLPPSSNEVRMSPELAVIVGRRLENASVETSLNAILGYCCANDVYARDIYLKDNYRPRGKTFRTFCPLGPAIETELDPSALTVWGRLNGEQVHEYSTEQMFFKIGELLHHFSQVVTFHPWDVLITGAAGSTVIADGDVSEVEIEGLGVLRNPVQMNHKRGV